MDIVVSDPNFSVVVPGGCNARCEFCFWGEKDNLSTNKFNARLKEIINMLPDDFHQVSITGGEPTLCSGVQKILKTVRERFDKVVFTTNGVALAADMIKDTVDHVNISRHHINDAENDLIYGVRGMPTAEQIAWLCDEMNEVGIDFTLHCVLTEYFKTADDIKEYIKFARTMGDSGVSFRKPHGNRSTNAPSNLERKFSKYKATYESDCPVCHSKTQIIGGMSVNWRSSSLEPSQGMDGIYELIMHQDGLLTSDWEARHIVELEEDADDVIMRIRMMGKRKPKMKKVDNTEVIEEIRRARRVVDLQNSSSSNGSSCGGGSSARGSSSCGR